MTKYGKLADNLTESEETADSIRERLTMNWEALTAISTAFTGLVIVATVIAGFVQIRQLREQQRDAASVELV